MITQFHPVRRLVLLTIAVLGGVAGAESDAVAISNTIQMRHMPHGTILDPVFASSTSDQIVSYSRCGDSAIWTGHYLAAEAFRYKVTHSAAALANAAGAVAGIKSLLDVTGNNVLARCLVPDNSPYAQAIQQEEAHNGIYHSAPGNFWVGNTSRDQYAGALFGLGVAYDMIDDAALKSTIAAQITRMVQFLHSKAWNVVLPDGTITTSFLNRPDQQLAFLQLARHVNPSAFSTDYDVSRVLLSPLIIVPIGIDVLADSSYFKFNLDYINLYTLVRLESSTFGDLYHKAYDILRNHTAGHGNALFDAVDRALNGPNAARDSELLTLLDQWLTRPRRDFYVDLRGTYAACGDANTACSPIPVAQRVNTDYLWQRSPFQLSGGGSGVIETAGIDYILPYWMARYYGVTGGLQALSAASWSAVISPDSIATIAGTVLAASPQAALTQPPPTTLGGIMLLVTDSKGVTLSAPLYYVSPSQINFVIPSGSAPGPTTIRIQRSGAADQVGSAMIQAVAPALFTMNGAGAGVAAATAIRTVSGRVSIVPVFACGSDGCVSVPINVGVDAPVYVSLYATGIRNRSSLANVTCSIGGVNVPVTYAGPQNQSAGLDQVNISLTLNLRGMGEKDLVLTVDGKPSNAVRINIE